MVSMRVWQGAGRPRTVLTWLKKVLYLNLQKKQWLVFPVFLVECGDVCFGEEFLVKRNGSEFHILVIMGTLIVLRNKISCPEAFLKNQGNEFRIMFCMKEWLVLCCCVVCVCVYFSFFFFLPSRGIHLSFVLLQLLWWQLFNGNSEKTRVWNIDMAVALEYTFSYWLRAAGTLWILGKTRNLILGQEWLSHNQELPVLEKRSL